MSIESRITSDMQRLADATRRAMPSLAQTAESLRVARAQRGQRPQGRALAGALALSAAVLCIGTSWNAVSAFARDVLFRVVIELTGKSDDQAAAEIREQLDAQGWAPSSVSVQHTGAEVRIELSAENDAGRRIQLQRREPGAIAGPVELAPEPIDDTREPGMSDAALRDKILRQLRARGIDEADVTVSGDQVRVRARRQPPR